MMRVSGKGKPRCLWLLVLLLAALAASACQGAGDWLTGKAEPTATGTPTPVALATPAVQPPLVGAVLKQGRPYLQERLSGGLLSYEPWVPYQTVRQVKETLAVTRGVQELELGVTELPPFDVFIALESQFNQFAKENEFQQPTWLAGFAAYKMRAGEAIDVNVYVNAQAVGIVHNTAHELTHVAAPNLPQWLGEGVAEYIATRVDRELGSPGLEERALDARGKVRRAVRQGDLPDPAQLQGFDWMNPDNYRRLDLLYAEAWLLVEYLVQSQGSAILQDTLHAYQKADEDSLAPLEEALGFPAQSLWTGFVQDIQENLEPEEQVGESLCALGRLEAEGTELAIAWNRFLLRGGRGGEAQGTAELRQFREAWSMLLSVVTGTSALGDAGPIRDTMTSYAESMVRAMDLLSQGRTAEGNSALIKANQQRQATGDALQQALAHRRGWLSCEA
ncbi:MAG: hypothetical protein HY680_05330 [Chloroflexi bacterium]|nr:hypothetical protein [Chloroflexota bacterium]